MRAAVLYWDGDGAGTVGGGNGVWDQTVSSWSLTANGTTYQAWNNAASPTDDAVLQNTAGTLTLGVPITVRSITARTNGYVIAGSSLTLAGGTGVFDVGTATTVGLTVNSTVTGSTGLTKQGVGVLTLNAANSFTGGTTLSAGTLNLGNDGALGAAKLTLAGGTLSAVTSARTLANAVDVAANTTLGGTLALNLTGPVVLTGSRTVTVNNTALTTWSGGLGETGGARNFTKAGGGALLLTAASTNTGTTTLTGGTLALGPSGTISGANLILNGGVLASGSNFTRSLGTGAGAVSFGTGGGGFAAYGAPINITGFTGTPVWGTTPQFLGATASLILNSTLADNVVTWTTPFSLGTGNRTVNVLDNTASTADYAVISGLISGTGGLIKTGAGRLDLTAANTYTGTTLINAGQVWINSLSNAGVASSLGAPTGANATIQLGLTTVAGTLVYTGPATSSDRGLTLAGTTGGGVLQADGTGPLTLSGAISSSVAGAKTLTLTGANLGNNTLSGPLTNGTGTVALTKSGLGRWILSGNNTYSGVTTLSAGALVAGSDTALGTGPLTLAGGTLEGTAGPRALANSVNLTASSVLGGASNLTFTGSFAQSTGSRTLTANNTAATTFAGPTFTLAENNQARTLTIAVNGGPVAISSVVSAGPGTGADGLTKSGLGQLTLSGNNTYTGVTTLSAGTLVAGSDTALGTGPLTLAGGTIAGASGPRTLANAVNLTASSVLGGASNLTFTGAVAQSTGSRTLTANNTAATTFAGPTFTLAENNQARTLTVAVNGGPVAISGVVSDGTGTGADGLTKSGPGQLILSGPNTYTGATSIQSGSVSVNTLGNLATASALGAPAAAATGTIALGSAATTGTLIYTGGTASTNRVVNLAGTTGGGVLDASGSGALTFTSAFTATGAGSKLLTLTGNSSAANTIAGAIVNNSATNLTRVNKTGTGTWVLSGANTFTGNLTVSAGTLRLGANNVLPDTAPVVLAGGTLDVSGRTDTAGTLNLAASSTIDFGASAAAIVFAASNGLTWSGATLTISNYTTGVDSLRFGAGASSLTATQLGRFRFVDFGNAAGQIDAFGFVTPVPEPAAFAVLAGLVALGGTFWRRRRGSLAEHPRHGAR